VSTTDRVDQILASGRIPDQLAATVTDFVGGGTDRDHMSTLLDAYLAHPEWESVFERALATEDKFRALSGAVAGIVAEGAEAEQVRYRLEAYHLQLMSQDRDADDDVVLEVLDELVGF
jgi:hypothetical protein